MLLPVSERRPGVLAPAAIGQGDRDARRRDFVIQSLRPCGGDDDPQCHGADGRAGQPGVIAPPRQPDAVQAKKIKGTTLLLTAGPRRRWPWRSLSRATECGKHSQRKSGSGRLQAPATSRQKTRFGRRGSLLLMAVDPSGPAPFPFCSEGREDRFALFPTAIFPSGPTTDLRRPSPYLFGAGRCPGRHLGNSSPHRGRAWTTMATAPAGTRDGAITVAPDEWRRSVPARRSNANAGPTGQRRPRASCKPAANPSRSSSPSEGAEPGLPRGGPARGCGGSHAGWPGRIAPRCRRAPPR